jgi:hypothetical protein
MYLEPAYDAVHTYTYWVVIRAYATPGRQQRHCLRWLGLTWEVRCKWAWYFRYRTALLQVQHPRLEVEMTWGKTPKANYEELERVNNIRAKKAKITETSNKLAKAREGWKQLFPIETHPSYQKAMAKLERLKAELADLERQVNDG